MRVDHSADSIDFRLKSLTGCSAMIFGSARLMPFMIGSHADWHAVRCLSIRWVDSLQNFADGLGGAGGNCSIIDELRWSWVWS